MGVDGRRYAGLLGKGGGTEPLTSLDGTAHSCAHKPPRNKLLMAGVPERELYPYKICSILTQEFYIFAVTLL